MKSSKGSVFERKVCRLLSEWWSEGKSDSCFWRSASSGAMAKVRSRKGKRTFGQYGDIQATDPSAQPFLDNMTVELKRGYSQWSVLDVLDKTERNSLQTLEEFIIQCEEDRKNAGVDYFMLITKRDKRVPVVFIPRKFYLEMSDFLGPFSESHSDYCPVVLRFKIRDHFNDYIVGFRFTDFFKWCDPSFFLQEK